MKPVATEDDYIVISDKHSAEHRIKLNNPDAQIIISGKKAVTKTSISVVCPEHGMVTATLISTSSNTYENGKIHRNGDEVHMCGGIGKLEVQDRGIKSK